LLVRNIGIVATTQGVLSTQKLRAMQKAGNSRRAKESGSVEPVVRNCSLIQIYRQGIYKSKYFKVFLIILFPNIHFYI